MSKSKKESLFVVSYSGRETADRAYDVLRQMEKDKQVDIKTAMTVFRKDNGKLLGSNDSALAVLVKEADWDAVDKAMEPFGGETLLVELTDEDAAAIEAWATTDEAAAAAEEEVEVVEEDDVEIVD